MEFNEWLAQSWIYLAAVAAGLVVVINLVKNIKIVVNELQKPLTAIQADVKEIKNRQVVQEEATKSLLRERIIGSYNTCKERGYATLVEKQSFESMFERYDTLKGNNGFIEALHEKFMKLPDEPNEEEV